MIVFLILIYSIITAYLFLFFCHQHHGFINSASNYFILFSPICITSLNTALYLCTIIVMVHVVNMSSRLTWWCNCLYSASSREHGMKTTLYAGYKSRLRTAPSVGSWISFVGGSQQRLSPTGSDHDTRTLNGAALWMDEERVTLVCVKSSWLKSRDYVLTLRVLNLSALGVSKRVLNEIEDLSFTPHHSIPFPATSRHPDATMFDELEPYGSECSALPRFGNVR